VDSPSRGAVSPCIGFQILNPSTCQVCLNCIVYHVISYSCLAFCLRNHLFYLHIFSCYLEKLLQIFFRDDSQKHVKRLLFCLGISKPLSLMTTLILPYMLGLDVISFSISMSLLFFCFIIFKIKKKKWRRRCRILFFLLIAFQLLYVFWPDISVHCALIEYAYI